MPISEGVASALIGGAASVIGTGATVANAAIQNKKSYRYSTKYLDYQNAMNIENWNRENAYNLEMWNKQNAYNSPAAQMQRYQAAGLNPNLVYGNGSSSSGNADAVGTGSIGDASSGQFQVSGPGLDLAVSQGLQALSTLSQVGLNRANEKYAGANTYNAALQGKLLGVQYDVANSTKAEDIALKKLGVSDKAIEIYNKTKQGQFLSEQIRGQKWQNDYNVLTQELQRQTLIASLGQIKTQNQILGYERDYARQMRRYQLNPKGESAPWSFLFSKYPQIIDKLKEWSPQVFDYFNDPKGYIWTGSQSRRKSPGGGGR